MKNVILLALLMLGVAQACQYKGSSQFIQLALDAEGGIAAPRPSLEVLVIRKPDGSAVVLSKQDEQVRRGTLKSFDSLAAKLQPVLKLPQEKNPGMSDAYGFEDALHVHLAGQCWQHGPPAGCVRGQPTIHPDAAEKATFSQATAEISGLARVATAPASMEAWNQARKSL